MGTSMARRLELWTTSRGFALLGIVGISAIAPLVVFLVTSRGIGLRDDSFLYFSAAEGIVEQGRYGRIRGTGDFVPLTNFPPLYSGLLGAFHVSGLELEASARLVAGLCFFGLALVVGLTLLRGTGNAFVAVFGSAATVLSPIFIETFSWAQSEGPYLFLVAGSLGLLSYIGSSKRSLAVSDVAVAVTISLAILTRFAALSLIPIAVFLVVSGERESHWKRLLLWAGSPILVLAAFLIRNLLVAGDLTNRPSPFWHPPSTGLLEQASATALSEFGIHAHGNAWVVALGLAALVVPLLVAGYDASRRLLRTASPSEHGSSRSRLILAHELHLLSYSALVLVTVFFLDRLVPLDSRILAPYFVSLVWLGIAFLDHGLSHARMLPRTLIGAIAIVIMAARLQGAAESSRALAQEGQGFNSNRWKTSSIMREVRSLPDGPIYTNDVAAMYFLADRRASYIPAQYNPAADRSRDDYSRQLSQMRRSLGQGSGYLVFVGWDPANRTEPSHFKELTRGLQLLLETSDGLIFCDCEAGER